MAVSHGYSSIATSGSVFLYDTGDRVNSWKGQPITNQFAVVGTSGFGAAADNAVNFAVQGTTGFVRLGYGQNFGGYVIQPNDVVYKYPFNSAINGCHYHGNTASIPAGAYLTFTFDYYISPDTDFSTGNSTFLSNTENYGGGALSAGVDLPNYSKGIWQTVTYTAGPRGSGTGTQAMFLYPGGCGGNIATNGYILFKNPRVYWLSYDVPFVNGTRSTTQGMIDIVGGNTIDLTNMTYGANNAISFDGTDDTTGVTTNVTLGSTFSLEAVININSRTNGDVIGSWNNPFRFLWRVNTSGYQLLAWNGGGAAQEAAGTTIVSTGAFNHITMTYDGTNVRFYNNGVFTNAVAKGFSLSNITAMQVGSNTYDSVYFNGQIPVAKIYNRTLSAGEVLNNFNHYKTRFNIA